MQSNLHLRNLRKKSGIFSVGEWKRFPWGIHFFSIPKQDYCSFLQWFCLQSHSSIFNPFLLYTLHQISFSPYPFILQDPDEGDIEFCCLRDRPCCCCPEKEKKLKMHQGRKLWRQTLSLACYTHCWQSRWDREESPSHICNLLPTLGLSEKLSPGCLHLSLPQARQTCQPELLLFAECHSKQLHPHAGLEHPTPPLLTAALSSLPSHSHHCSHYRDLLSHPVHLQFCWFMSNRRVKEVDIYRPHLPCSPLLQQYKQLLPRSLIIHNLLLPAWLASILPIWCFSWTPTPSFPASLTACGERNTFPFLFHIFFPFNLSC